MNYYTSSKMFATSTNLASVDLGKNAKKIIQNSAKNLSALGHKNSTPKDVITNVTIYTQLPAGTLSNPENVPEINADSIT